MIFSKMARRCSVIFAGLVTMLLTTTASAEYELNMTEGVTPISQQIYGLHMLVFWICVVIGVLVFALWRGRLSTTANPEAPRPLIFTKALPSRSSGPWCH